MTTPISPFRRGTGSYYQVSHLAAWSASKDDRESGLGTGLVSGVRSPSIPRVQKTARGTALERAVAADTSAIKASTDGRVPSDAIVSPSSPSSEALRNQRWRGPCRRTRGLGISAQWLRFRPLGVEVEELTRPAPISSISPSRQEIGDTAGGGLSTAAGGHA